MFADHYCVRRRLTRLAAALPLMLALLASPILTSCSDTGFAGTWKGVDEANQGAGLEIVQVEDHWKAKQLDQSVLPWDANLFLEKNGRLVSFGDSRPSFKATISLEGDVLTVEAPGRSYRYRRE